MSERPDVNDRYPIRESLSPPIITHPVFECAQAVHVTGFMAHARVRVFANQTDLLAEVEPPFGFETITLNRPVQVGEALTARQEVNGQISPHSIIPVVVLPLDGNRVRNTKPDIVEPIYQCGLVVPVNNLVPSTRLTVTQDGAQIGQAAVAEVYHAVVTTPMKFGLPVSAVAIACPGTGHEVKGPAADDVLPLAAPNPPPAPAVEPGSLIKGNDVVTLTGLLVGAAVQIFEDGVLVCTGWLANAGANVFPLTQRLSGKPVTATQELCGNTSPPSPPVTPEGKLDPPLIVGPICAGARFVVIRNSIINATVVVFRNGQITTHGGAAPGDLVLGLGQNTSLAAGDVITAIQYMNGTISGTSIAVTVSAGLSEPSIEILGGESFFWPKPREEPIPGPVFPRGRGPGPLIRIQACCTREVRAWITDTRGQKIADLALDELYPGYFQTTWSWNSDQGWKIPDGIPVGQYEVHVRSGCHEREARAPFFIIFDPAAVGGPPRFSFDGTAIWFGSGSNSISALHYYLRCSDWRVFKIAIGAATGHTVPYGAAAAVARAEEALFGYSLSYHTNDVLHLITGFSEAQCADDAACLTALLRAVGIPAHPVTADAALENGAANWTFDTWVEFLSDHAGSREWRIFHPHEYPGMAPESRAQFGTRGVANKGFNDLIVMAGEQWVSGHVDDGSSDVTYSRNSCGEPQQSLNKAAWVDELCEAGYWAQAHWDCAGVTPRSLSVGNGFRFDVSEAVWGGRIAGTIHLENRRFDRVFGRSAVELVADRMESKAFGEVSIGIREQRVTLDPNASLAIPFEFSLPRTLEPGLELYLRATLNERTAAIQRLRVRPLLAAEIEMPDIILESEDAAVEISLRNLDDRDVHGIAVAVRSPFALDFGRGTRQRVDVLVGGQAVDLRFVGRAIASLPSGSLHLAVSSEDGGGLLIRKPFTIAPHFGREMAAPGIRLPERGSSRTRKERR